MKKIVVILLLSLAIISQAQESMHSIIPVPYHAQAIRSRFIINKNTVIKYEDAKLKFEAEWLANKIQENAGIELKINPEFSLEKSINLIISDTAKWCEAEGYHLFISNNQISLIAAKPAGIFYGLQTLVQLFPLHNKQKEIELQGFRISDKPAYKWRGLNMDCCRHFMQKEFVMKYIDLLAMHKMNTFHWHLTEDQAWRIEIKKYPKLTEVGAWRIDPDGKRYGGFYTQEDIKEVVEYAKKRHINIVPEIELPGHALAALASYPELSCTGGPFVIEKRWGVFDDIYCAGNDSVFIFLKDILDEVIELFPSKYIHIGGDEAPKIRWENCKKCQKRIKDENLKDEFELQSWFVNQIGDYLLQKGRRIIGWDEILEGGADKLKNVTVQSWRGFDGAKQAAESENFAIVSAADYCYLDADPGNTSLEKVYSFNPIPKGLAEENWHRIVGSEACIWTETAPQEVVDSRVFPRLCALAEVIWSPRNTRNWEDFNERLKAHYIRLRMLDVKYGFERLPLSLEIEFDNDKNGFVCKIIPGQEGLKFEYALVKNKKQSVFREYSEPVLANDANEFKLKVFNAYGELMGNYSRRFSLHKAVNKNIKLISSYSDLYPASGNKALIDGIKGTDGFRDGIWQGYHGKDFEAIIDLRKIETVRYVSTGFLQSTLAWIFYPLKMKVYSSINGRKWRKLGEIENTISEKNPDNSTQILDLSFEPQKARYIKIIAPALGKCPDWHRGAGEKAWIFIDEIEIY
ncbi:MAG: family 20 glycosylhydrolase [Bacteroidales bacterium]|nr:family 20 glycosylhydrolase [Bacteroidales bacterium]